MSLLTKVTTVMICGIFSSLLMAATVGVSLTPQESVRVKIEGLEVQGTIRAFAITQEGSVTSVSMPVIEFTLNGKLNRVDFSMKTDDAHLDSAKTICGLLEMKKSQRAGRGFNEGDLKAYMEKSNGGFIVSVEKHNYTDSMNANEVRITSVKCSK